MQVIPFLNKEQITDLQLKESLSTKEQKLTKEQIEAIYSSGENILVSASAGSGKTFVMVQRILDQLSRGICVDQLFISTFTVKAAGELRERLEKELSKAIATEQDEQLKRHLAQQIPLISTADIGTMDSFTQKILNEYGYLISVAPNFRILQNDSERLILQNEVFDQLFERYYESNQQEVFSKLVKNFTGKRKDVLGFRQQVYRIYNFLQSTSNPKQWMDTTFLRGCYQTDFDTERRQLVEKVKHALFDLESFFHSHLEGEGQLFKKAKYQENIADVLEQIAQLNEIAKEETILNVLQKVLSYNAQAFTARVGKTADDYKKEVAKDFNESRKPFIEALKGLNSQFFQLEFMEKYQEDSNLILELLKDFVLDFSQMYLKRKQEENVFEFGDISHFAIQILEEFPQVRTFYQEKYHEIMVDEYQDTNHTQERMLELLSNGQNRFMVGDIKQSIYRFRQADPQIFNDKFKRYQADPLQGKLIVLKENFRSHVEVLEATNDIFKHLMDEEVGEIDYNLTHYLVAGNPSNQIAHPSYKAECLLYDDSVADSDEDEGDVTSASEVALVIKEIIRLHNEEGVAFKDITLLTASRTRNNLILNEFAKFDIPIIPDGGEDNYLQSVEVMVMLDTLRTINNPLNDYALVALLKSPMFNFTEDELARLSLQESSSHSQENFYEKLRNALKNKGSQPDLISPSFKKKLQHFEETLQDWRLFSKNHSLYDLIWKIYQDRFYYDIVGALPNGAYRQANLYALSLRANDYEKTSFKGLSRFVSMIDRVLANQHDLASVMPAVPVDAVHLMTVHKSKGLEFKYVFLINLDKAFNKQDSHSSIILSRKNGIGIKYVADVLLSAAETQETSTVHISMDTLPYKKNSEELHLASLSEQMRLLYVAMTRAKNKLYLVGKGKQEKLEAKNWGKNCNGRLDTEIRKELHSFQDWIFAIKTVFHQENLSFDLRFVMDNELTMEKIGSIQQKSPIQIDNLANNRQTEDLARALDILANVDALNSQYAAAINLPSVRTPSQIKKFYEPIMDVDGVEIMRETPVSNRNSTIHFELPCFDKKGQVSGAQIGSAIHELMQRVPLEKKPTESVLKQILKQMSVEQQVKNRIDLLKIVSFFDTELGEMIMKHPDKVHREAPFAMLKIDPMSKQDFVVRGILDGYLLFDDRIVLFDYKTDKYHFPEELVERYHSQLSLYAEALARSYEIQTIEKYLILLGGKDIQVVEVK
ncbi:MAG: helicase-exonuclease AddAB subunit AddA [Streptococcus sp.]|nr:helicase-exonuclease AddAB subunit AddA [Streptococcus sp.]